MANPPTEGELVQVAARSEHLLDAHGRPVPPLVIVPWGPYWQRRYQDGDIDVYRLGDNAGHIAADKSAEKENA